MIDILVNSDNDLQIIAEDIAIGRSNEQHKEHLLIAETGTLIEDITVGVNLIQFVNGDDEVGMLQKISEEYTKDGINVTSILTDDEGNIITNGDYKN
jgi:hypothetical protein